jgi:hypothetical protein
MVPEGGDRFGELPVRILDIFEFPTKLKVNDRYLIHIGEQDWNLSALEQLVSH